jgi:hypothetical protein
LPMRRVGFKPAVVVAAEKISAGRTDQVFCVPLIA